MRSTGLPGELSHQFFKAMISNSVPSLQNIYPNPNPSLPGNSLFSFCRENRNHWESIPSTCWHSTYTESSFSSLLSLLSLYQNSCLQCCTWITFSHSLTWPWHKLTLKRTLSFSKNIPTLALFSPSHLVWILHFPRTTLVICILGILHGFFPFFAPQIQIFNGILSLKNMKALL